jgi:Plasmid pRiA4b ORF-3-like protein.
MIDQLKLILRGTYHPPVWIRIEADQITTFVSLHQLIQVTFDWGDIMLHDFEVPNTRPKSGKPVGGLNLNHPVKFAVKYLAPTLHIGPLEDTDSGETLDDDDILDEQTCRLNHFLKRPGDRALHLFDLDEDREANVLLEEKHHAWKNATCPRCIKVSNGYVYFITEQD